MTNSELYLVKSLMETVKSKIALLYENSEPYNIINGFHRELDVAYSKSLPLCGPKEEEEELWNGRVTYDRRIIVNLKNNNSKMMFLYLWYFDVLLEYDLVYFYSSPFSSLSFFHFSLSVSLSLIYSLSLSFSPSPILSLSLHFSLSCLSPHLLLPSSYIPFLFLSPPLSSALLWI